MLLMEKQNNDNNKNTSEIVKSFLELKYLDQINLLSNTYFWETRSVRSGVYTLSDKPMERWKEKIAYETLSATYKLNHNNLRFSWTFTFAEKVYKSNLEGILNGDFIRINNINDKMTTDLS